MSVFDLSFRIHTKKLKSPKCLNFFQNFKKKKFEWERERETLLSNKNKKTYTLMWKKIVLRFFWKQNPKAEWNRDCHPKIYSIRFHSLPRVYYFSLSLKIFVHHHDHHHQRSAALWFLSQQRKRHLDVSNSSQICISAWPPPTIRRRTTKNISIAHNL